MAPKRIKKNSEVEDKESYPIKKSKAEEKLPPPPPEVKDESPNIPTETTCLCRCCLDATCSICTIKWGFPDVVKNTVKESKNKRMTNVVKRVKGQISLPTVNVDVGDRTSQQPRCPCDCCDAANCLRCVLYGGTKLVNVPKNEKEKED